MGYAGFLTVVPWIQAFIWAFKPTDIVDIRRFPHEEAKGIDEEIARLSGKPAPAATETPAAQIRRGRATNTRQLKGAIMVLALGMLFGFMVFVWLVFFKFKWLKFSVAWALCQRVLRGACAPDFPDRAALRDAGLEQCQGRPAHHPVGPAPDRADAGDGGAGRAEPARQERPAAVPVRPAALRIQGASNSKPNSRRPNKMC